jgi:hypothetical protein
VGGWPFDGKEAWEEYWLAALARTSRLRCHTSPHGGSNGARLHHRGYPRISSGSMRRGASGFMQHSRVSGDVPKHFCGHGRPPRMFPKRDFCETSFPARRLPGYKLPGRQRTWEFLHIGSRTTLPACGNAATRPPEVSSRRPPEAPCSGRDLACRYEPGTDVTENEGRGDAGTRMVSMEVLGGRDAHGLCEWRQVQLRAMS